MIEVSRNCRALRLYTVISYHHPSLTIPHCADVLARMVRLDVYFKLNLYGRQELSADGRDGIASLDDAVDLRFPPSEKLAVLQLAVHSAASNLSTRRPL